MDDITISDINKDDIIGGAFTVFEEESDSEEESKSALSDIKIRNPLDNFILSEKKKKNLKKILLI